MASASSMYFMTATCCSLRLYSFPSTTTTTIKQSLLSIVRYYEHLKKELSIKMQLLDIFICSIEKVHFE